MFVLLLIRLYQKKNLQDLQIGIDIVENYCNKWKITFKENKIVIFRKGGKLGVNDKWFYNGSQIEVIKHFTYPGMAFSSGGSFSENQKK